MVWLQGTIGKPVQDRGITPDNEQRQAAQYAPGDPPCHGEKKNIWKEALDYVTREQIGDEKTEEVSVPRLEAYRATLSKEDQSHLERLADERSKERLKDWRPQTAEERIESLRVSLACAAPLFSFDCTVELEVFCRTVTNLTC